MKKRPIFIAVLVLSLQSFAFAEDRPHPVNGLMMVLVLSRQGNDWLATSSLIRQILTNTGRFDVRRCESPTGLSPRTPADFGVLVNNCGNPGLGSETEQDLKAFVESGKGLVICHGAMSSSAGLLGSDSSVQIDLREHPITRSITKQFLTTDS